LSVRPTQTDRRQALWTHEEKADGNNKQNLFGAEEIDHLFPSGLSRFNERNGGPLARLDAVRTKSP